MFQGKILFDPLNLRFEELLRSFYLCPDLVLKFVAEVFPYVSVAKYVPDQYKVYAAWLDAFLQAGVAAFVVDAPGIFNAPDLKTAGAVAVAVLYIPYIFDDLTFRVGNPLTLEGPAPPEKVVLFVQSSK